MMLVMINMVMYKGVVLRTGKAFFHQGFYCDRNFVMVCNATTVFLLQTNLPMHFGLSCQYFCS